jgi:hypothetical protein
MLWSEIPQRTRDGQYGVDVAWEDLEWSIKRYTENYNLDLCPDFQRGHVWTMEQRVAYLESKLSGGIQVDVIRFNHPDWGNSYEGQMVCVDGLQRLTTALMFLRDEVRAFGCLRSEFGGGKRGNYVPSTINFRININNLPTRAAVLKWYLEMNAGGTPHSASEIARVTALYEAEVARLQAEVASLKK